MQTNFLAPKLWGGAVNPPPPACGPVIITNRTDIRSCTWLISPNYDKKTTKYDIEKSEVSLLQTLFTSTKIKHEFISFLLSVFI